MMTFSFPAGDDVLLLKRFHAFLPPAPFWFDRVEPLVTLLAGELDSPPE